MACSSDTNHSRRMRCWPGLVKVSTWRESFFRTLVPRCATSPWRTKWRASFSSGGGSRLWPTPPGSLPRSRGTCQPPRACELRNPSENTFCPDPCTGYGCVARGSLGPVPRGPAENVPSRNFSALRGRGHRPGLRSGGFLAAWSEHSNRRMNPGRPRARSQNQNRESRRFRIRQSLGTWRPSRCSTNKHGRNRIRPWSKTENSEMRTTEHCGARIQPNSQCRPGAASLLSSRGTLPRRAGRKACPARRLFPRVLTLALDAGQRAECYLTRSLTEVGRLDPAQREIRQNSPSYTKRPCFQETSIGFFLETPIPYTKRPRKRKTSKGIFGGRGWRSGSFHPFNYLFSTE